MFSTWFGTTGSAVAAVGEAWVGVKEAAGGLTEKMSSLDGVAATLQQALLLDEPSAPPVLPPWDDVGPEADALPDASRLALRSQLMRLAKNKRNFTEGLPEGQEFEFRMEDHLHVAEAAVAADPQLRSIRFHLVPQYVGEIEFWRNYFWRIRLIRQAHGLPALFPLRPPTPPPSISPSSSSTAAEEGNKNGASSTTASGSPGQPSDDYDDSDDEAAFLAELEAMEKEHTSSLVVVASPVLPAALPLLATPTTSATAVMPPETGDAIRNNSDDGGSCSSGVVAAEGVPTPVAGAGVDASEEYSIEAGDNDDEEWEKELELELRAELGGLDSP